MILCLLPPFCDTLLTAPTERLKNQWNMIYHGCTSNGSLDMQYLHAKRQISSVNCGLFAIAYAYELCANGLSDEVCTLVFNQARSSQTFANLSGKWPIYSVPRINTGRIGDGCLKRVVLSVRSTVLRT